MKYFKCGGKPENGANRCLELRDGLKGEQKKQKTPVVVFGALSLVLSLAEQRKNEKQKEKFARANDPIRQSVESQAKR